MDTIVVKTDDLREILRELINDNALYTEFSIVESDDTEIPCDSFLVITTCDNIDMNGGEEYEYIDSVTTK